MFCPKYRMMNVVVASCAFAVPVVLTGCSDSDHDDKIVTIWGQSCQEGNLGICGKGTEGSGNYFICYDGYCTQDCTEGTESPCPDGYTCESPDDGSSDRVGGQGVCVKDAPAPTNYWGQACKAGEEGICGEGEEGADEDFICFNDYCTKDCTTGTENACEDGFTCQAPPGSTSEIAVGGPGICMKDGQ